MNTPTVHAELTDALREELALYAFGLLDHDEAARIARHLKAGCTVCNAEVQTVEQSIAAVSVAADPVSPSPQLKDRLMARIRTEKQDAAERPEPGISVLRSHRRKWKRTPWQGVAYIRLHYDAATGFSTSLLRIDPGARYPAHHHGGIEQSWVVEGSCRIGSVTIRVGDFACAEAGTDHAVLESDEGCVLLIVSSDKDEVLA